MVCFISFLTRADEAGQKNGENEIKAAITYHILHFASWPEKSPSYLKKRLVLGILGANPFGQAFDSLRGESIFGKKLEIKEFGEFPSMDEIAECHVLYISSSEADNLPKILSALQGASVLTVSDIHKFTDQGGMIGLIKVSNRIRFEINKTVSDREEIRIAAKVLRLAVRIK